MAAPRTSNSNSDFPPNPANPNLARLKPLIECSNCLGLGHTRKFCQNLVRCRLCWNYGHVLISCVNNLRDRRKYRMVSRRAGEESRREDTYMGKAPSLVTSDTSTSPRITVHPKTPILQWQTGLVILARSSRLDSPSKTVPSAPTFARRCSSPAATPSAMRILRSSSSTHRWTRGTSRT
jgi:hypothetical protein